MGSGATVVVNSIRFGMMKSRNVPFPGALKSRYEYTEIS